MNARRYLLSAGVFGVAACGFSGPTDPGGTLIDMTECKPIDDAKPHKLAKAKARGEHALMLAAQSDAATTWAIEGNEAVVLDVLGDGDRLIGHAVVHQGVAAFEYAMHVGALGDGETVSVRVSALTAPKAARRACVAARLIPAAELDVGEGLPHAPIFRWPVDKRFDDLPLVVGWSRAQRSFETVFSHEDGGTVGLCGGGAAGVRAELARWGRAADIEPIYAYGGAAPTWLRCAGEPTTPLRTEDAHPILYYGDGSNRLFESRDGYGRACGAMADRKASGDLDALGYAELGGRREALIDSYAPWLYRLTALELQRERMVDDRQVVAMERYLYVDVKVADVGGTGDETCGPRPQPGGFRLRAVTASPPMSNGWLMTATYAGAGHDWKRVAIPLPASTRAQDITGFSFDALDRDGVYVTAIGDAFMVQPDAANGATLEYVRRGERAVMMYVDDDNTECSGSGDGVNTRGPGGVPYTCMGTTAQIDK